MINEINWNIKYVPQQEKFYEKPFNEVTKKCKNRDFPSVELEKLRCICVDEVYTDLQHPVEVSNIAHLTSGAAASSINRMAWNAYIILLEKVITWTNSDA